MAEKNWFDGLYGDLFEGGSNGGKNPPENPLENNRTEDPFHITEEEMLSHAEDAIKEAQELLGNLDSIIDVDAIRKKKVDRPSDASGSTDVSGNAEGKENKNQNETPKKDEKDLKDHLPGDQPKDAKPDGNGAVQEQEKPQEPEEDPMEKLDQLIGLTTIKHDVKELTDFVRIQKLRKEEGLKSVPVSLHLVFTGNPGTGKTTVARILASLYKQIGVLSQGQLVEVDRSGLVAGYVGQTAIKTQEKIQEAMGGVLFIDEAYSLAQKDDAFGQEAIDTILKAMEDHRDDFVVIVAGYTEPMEKFINSNPGLKSRFNKYIEFPDYTVEELEGIFDMNCKKYDYVVEDDARAQIRELIKLRKLTRRENFANAREVRNLFEEMITNQARRVADMENPTHEDMMTLTLADLKDEDAAPADSTETVNGIQANHAEASDPAGLIFLPEEPSGENPEENLEAEDWKSKLL